MATILKEKFNIVEIKEILYHNQLKLYKEKFNKNLILLSLREMTNLTTKEIRVSLKKFKSLYIFIINKIT